jgi:hypothetical protein
MWSGGAQAHDYLLNDDWASLEVLALDMDRILDELFTTYLGCNLWSTACAGPAMWSQVPGQSGPDWGTADNGATPGTYATSPTGIIDSDHMALLDAVLNPNSPACASLPAGRVATIRAAFQANLATVLTQELTIQDIRISTTLSTGCTYDFLTTVTTGQNKALTLNGGSGALCFLSNGQSFDFDVPSLFGTFGDGPLLNEAHPQLGAALANLTAAYMTIGDDRAVAYWQAFMGRLSLTFVQELLPGLLQSIGKKNAVGTSITETDVEFWKSQPGYDPQIQPEYLKEAPLSTKVTCAPWGEVGPLDETITVTVDVIGEVDIRIRLTDARMCTTITNFANKWNCSSFDCTTKTFLASGIQGDLNGDGQFNLQSYNLAAGPLDVFLSYEFAAFADPIVISTQPVSQTIVAGNGASFTLAFDQITIEPYDVQWYSGSQSDGSDLTAISGAINTTLTLPVQNTGGITYYQGRVSDPCGNTTTATDIVSLLVEPLVVITGQPAGATTNLQTNVNLTVVATISLGGLEYQWQKFNTGLATWENLLGEVAATLSITDAALSDAGQYRCVVNSDTYSTSATSSNATVTVTVPSISISVQPTGGEFAEGDPVDLTVVASIPLSPPDFLGTLSIVWFKNGVNTGVTGDTYSIPSFGLGDTGGYFARITSDDFPVGPNQRQLNSSEVNLSVASGLAFRVDLSAPRPGNNPAGETWEDAFETIQEGINAANAAGGGEVWVAGGPGPAYYVYNEVRSELWGAPESASGSLIMKDNVKLYGGFEGYTGPNGPGTGLREVVRSQRSVHNVPTTISGTGTRNGGLNDAYHVVVFGQVAARTENARIDGFIITGGRATGAPGDYHSWRGAGIFNYGSAPEIWNCTFTDNIAEVAGGAIANEDNSGVGSGNAAIVNCVFYNNTANREADTAGTAIRGGGAIFNNLSTPTVQFSTIYGNAVGNPGYTDGGVLSSGIYNWESSPVINSTILWNNTAGDILTEGPDGHSFAAQVTYSNVQDGVLPGTGNISSDPLFATTGPEFLLGPGSPSLETADPGLSGAVTTDLRGVPRPQPSAGASDQGAFEDVAAPVLVCQDISVTLNSAGTVTINGGQLIDGASTIPALNWKLLVDDGGSPAANLLLDCSADTSPVQVTLTVIDLAGNTQTCVADVTLIDTTDPVAVCQDISVTLDGVTGTYTLTAAELDGGSSDICGAVTLSIPPTTFDCADASQVRVIELTVEDLGGNTDTCFANVTVQDTSGPIMTCVTPPAVQLDANGQGFILASAFDGGITDTCSNPVSLSIDQSSFTCADLGLVDVTVTAEDSLGNPSTCIVSVTVEDNVDPVITLTGPSSVTVLINTAYVEQGAVAEDNCDGTQPAVVGGDVVDTSVETTYTVTYDYTDGSGNTAGQVTREVNIISNPPAVITVLGDNPAIVECGVDVYQDAGATAEDWDAAGDPLGDISDDIITTGLPIDTTTPGTQVVTYEVADDIGSITIETRDVIVQDNLAPAIIVLGSNPLGLAVGDTFTDPGVDIDDACDLSVTPIVGGDAVDTNTPGEYVITYDATDSEGNDALQQTRTVIVVEELLNFGGVSPDVQAYIDDVPFDITATFAGGSNPATYEWSEATLGVVDSGAVSGSSNTVALTVTPGNGVGESAIGQYEYTATVTDDIGDVTSDAISVGIFARLAIGQDIADAEITLGDDYSMTFGVTGGIGALDYQWQVDSESQAKATWVNLSDSGNISGSGTDTLTFTGFLEENAGAYQCQVTDSGSDAITSSVAVLTASAGVPAAGVLGLMGLALLSALGGASAIRRRK